VRWIQLALMPNVVDAQNTVPKDQNLKIDLRDRMKWLEEIELQSGI
jgi:hypothetical protein